jgi:LPXTG-site transpeptidase (sortase) family protein
MTARPWRILGVLVALLGAVLFTVVVQRGVEAAPARESAAVGSAARSGSAPVTGQSPGTTTSAPTERPTPTRTPSPPAQSGGARPPTRSTATAAPKQQSAGTAPKQASSTGATGLRLRIPAIGLDRSVSGRGLSADGTINPLPGKVMWFTGYDRVRPGRTGTAVIAAHVAVGGRPDVFAALADVDVGDRVEVTEAGRTIRYTVRSARAVDKRALTTDQAVWGANDSASRLAIITCDDAFGFRSDGHRVANLVLIAERG